MGKQVVYIIKRLSSSVWLENVAHIFRMCKRWCVAASILNLRNLMFILRSLKVLEQATQVMIRVSESGSWSLKRMEIESEEPSWETTEWVVCLVYLFFCLFVWLHHKACGILFPDHTHASCSKSTVLTWTAREIPRMVLREVNWGLRLIGSVRDIK